MDQMGLFETQEKEVFEPLASRMRPRTLDEFVGQEHLLGKNKLLYRLIMNDQVSSMIFWGPPGVGKTTLARIIAEHTKEADCPVSTVNSLPCSRMRRSLTVWRSAETMRRTDRMRPGRLSKTGSKTGILE